MALLKKGSKGPEVKKLQQALNRNGAKPKVPEDGVFDPKTDEAVRAYQKKSKLKPDGIVGPKTMAALQAKGGGKPDAGDGGDAKGGSGGGSGGGAAAGKPPKWELDDYLKLVPVYEKKQSDYDKLHQKLEKAVGDKAKGSGATTALKELQDKYTPLRRALDEAVARLKPAARLQEQFEKLIRDKNMDQARDLLDIAKQQGQKADLAVKAAKKATDSYDAFTEQFRKGPNALI